MRRIMITSRVKEKNKLTQKQQHQLKLLLRSREKDIEIKGFQSYLCAHSIELFLCKILMINYQKSTKFFLFVKN